MIAPGGMGGAVTLRDDKEVQQLVASFYEKKKIVAFICAGKISHFQLTYRHSYSVFELVADKSIKINSLAPIVAKASGIPGNHKVTSYPSVKDQLKDCNYF